MSKDPYEQPLTPPATPPVIAPNVKPKTAAERAANGDCEGDVAGNRSKPAQIDTDLSEKLLRRQKRDGAGEAEHDSASPETLSSRI